MRCHIALNRPIDLERIAQEALTYQCPRFATGMLGQRLGATIHKPELYSVSPLDKIYSKIAGQPQQWALGRVLADQLDRNDLIFCPGEDIGIAVATVCGAKHRPKVAVFFHNIDRPRGRVALKLFRLAERIDLFIVCAHPQADFLRRYLNLPEHRVLFVWDQTDLKFFTPGAQSPNKTRPLVVSVGLEKRDYRLLAEATKDLEIDVKISGFSQDASVIARTFPQPMPANMSRQFYKWPDLVQLYRDADVVVVSLVENSYAAGVQALMEAMACRRPVIVTRTKGLAEYISDSNAITSVEPGNALELQQAITHLLNHPQEAEAKAQRGYQLALERHNSEKYVEVIAQRLQSL